MVDDQLGDHPQAALVGLGDETAGVGHAAVVRVHGLVFGDVVAVVTAWRGIERQQPQGVDAQLGDIVELADQAGEITDAVVVRVEERLDVQLVDDSVLVPQRVVDEGCRAGTLGHVRLLSFSGLLWPHAEATDVTQSLWERACPRSRHRGGWHRLCRCSRARPLPQGLR
ncbi:hypothetical protein D9M73_219210 [compost metagenome]